MKNIHLLPTDKPSSLYYKDDNYKLANSTIAIDWYISSAGYKPTNIYITSDEEIKDGDCFIGIKVEEDSEDNSFVIVTPQNKKQYVGSGTFAWVKKIILTTNPDLITDGVQAIDDEFLEWFVKNPKVEYVQVERLEDGKYVDYLVDGSAVEGVYENYKIIIPQEQYYNETFKSE